MQSLSDHRGYSMYKPSWLPHKTNNENVTAKGKKHLTSKSCWKGWELGRMGKGVWKARSMAGLWRQGRRMSVDEMDRQNAEHFSQVKDPNYGKGMQNSQDINQQGLRQCSQPCVTGIWKAQWRTSTAGAQNNHLSTFPLALLPGEIVDSHCVLVLPWYNSNGGKTWCLPQSG